MWGLSTIICNNTYDKPPYHHVDKDRFTIKPPKIEIITFNRKEKKLNQTAIYMIPVKDQVKQLGIERNKDNTPGIV